MHITHSADYSGIHFIYISLKNRNLSSHVKIFMIFLLDDVGVKSPYSTLKILHKHTIFLPL